MYGAKFYHWLMNNVGSFKSCNKVFFYYDSLFVMYLLYRKKKYALEPNWYISKRVYNNMVTECNNVLREIKNDGERITIGLVKFLSLFKTIDGGLYDLDKLFDAFHDYNEEIKSERELLDLIQRNKSSCVVTDSPFMQTIVRIMGTNSCGSRVFFNAFYVDNALTIYDSTINDYFAH